MNKNIKKPFTSFCDLDSVTIHCPCGATFTGEGKPVSSFISKHKSHTNGTMEDTITDDGMRAFSKDTPRKSVVKI